MEKINLFLIYTLLPLTIYFAIQLLGIYFINRQKKAINAYLSFLGLLLAVSIGFSIVWPFLYLLFALIYAINLKISYSDALDHFEFLMKIPMEILYIGSTAFVTLANKIAPTTLFAWEPATSNPIFILSYSSLLFVSIGSLIFYRKSKARNYISFNQQLFITTIALVVTYGIGLGAHYLFTK